MANIVTTEVFDQAIAAVDIVASAGVGPLHGAPGNRRLRSLQNVSHRRHYSADHDHLYPAHAHLEHPFP